MNSEQRKKHLAQVQCVKVSVSSAIDAGTPSLSSKPILSTCSSGLSVSLESAAEKVNIPLGCLQGIWEKAQKLIRAPNAITTAPGQDPEARMVLSYSGSIPHMVTSKKGGEFCCSQSCPNWKAMHTQLLSLRLTIS